MDVRDAPLTVQLPLALYSAHVVSVCVLRTSLRVQPVVNVIYYLYKTDGRSCNVNDPFVEAGVPLYILRRCGVARACYLPVQTRSLG